MANLKEELKAFERMFSVKEQELLVRKADIWQLLDSQHTSKKTVAAQAIVCGWDKELDAAVSALLANQDLREKFPSQTQALHRYSFELRYYIRDMYEALIRDLETRQKAETDLKVDATSSTSLLISAATGAYAASKGGLIPPEVMGPGQAVVTGAGLASLVAFRKPIVSAFRSAGKSLCEFPDAFRQSIIISYIRYTAVETGQTIKVSFRAGRVLSGCV